VRRQDREFRCADRFHFTNNEILSQIPEPSATDYPAGLTADHLCGHAVIRILLPADKDHVANLEICEFRALAVLAVSRLIRNLNGHRSAVRLGQLQRSFADRRDLSKQRPALALVWSSSLACR